ncbi:hypothetical protein FACS1894163_00010 [Spirochaetia bacterium]|nr:hypothetical protein FACS1894163_00010 [Spirochaetia bacterium]
MNRGEVNTARTANPDEKRDALQWETIDWAVVEQFINKAQTRIASDIGPRRRRQETKSWYGNYNACSLIRIMRSCGQHEK